MAVFGCAERMTQLMGNHYPSYYLWYVTLLPDVFSGLLPRDGALVVGLTAA